MRFGRAGQRYVVYRRARLQRGQRGQRGLQEVWQARQVALGSGQVVQAGVGLQLDFQVVAKAAKANGQIVNGAGAQHVQPGLRAGQAQGLVIGLHIDQRCEQSPLSAQQP